MKILGMFMVVLLSVVLGLSLSALEGRGVSLVSERIELVGGVLD